MHRLLPKHGVDCEFFGVLFMCYATLGFIIKMKSMCFSFHGFMNILNNLCNHCMKQFMISCKLGVMLTLVTTHYLKKGKIVIMIDFINV
jgi:hypothetical protein